MIANGDSPLIQNQIERARVPVKTVCKKGLKEYTTHKDSTEFVIEDKKYSFNFILPKDAFYAIMMTQQLLQTLNVPFDTSFRKFSIPPGRSSLSKGIKNTTLIDSTYNATPDGVRSILEMFGQYPAQNKWLVMGDMIELGEQERKEHEKLADLISKIKFSKIILVGPRLSRYASPKLKNALQFTMPKDVLDYLKENLKGKEVILFKGARFLEGIITHLLSNKDDVSKLCRQEKIWQERRMQWGL